MLKSKEKEENVKKQTIRDIKKASKEKRKIEKKEGKKKVKTKKKHIEPGKIAAIIIVSIIVATMLFGACATLIFYLEYYGL